VSRAHSSRRRTAPKRGSIGWDASWQKVRGFSASQPCRLPHVYPAGDGQISHDRQPRPGSSHGMYPAGGTNHQVDPANDLLLSRCRCVAVCSQMPPRALFATVTACRRPLTRPAHQRRGHLLWLQRERRVRSPTGTSGQQPRPLTRRSGRTTPRKRRLPNPGTAIRAPVPLQRHWSVPIHGGRSLPGRSLAIVQTPYAFLSSLSDSVH
jgi:hypothetical protein